MENSNKETPKKLLHIQERGSATNFFLASPYGVIPEALRGGSSGLDDLAGLAFSASFLPLLPFLLALALVTLWTTS